MNDYMIIKRIESFLSDSFLDSLIIITIIMALLTAFAGFITVILIIFNSAIVFQACIIALALLCTTVFLILIGGWLTMLRDTL